MGGTPVFVGTRVPLATLLDYLEAGQPLSEFLEDFPTVTREQAVAALERSSPVRVLLDECVPRRLKRELVAHDVKTAPEMGWASKKNGELLALAAGEFDIFLTSDRNLSNRTDDLRSLVPGVLEVLGTAQAGTVTLVRA